MKIKQKDNISDLTTANIVYWIIGSICTIGLFLIYNSR
jgi:hypothetical protein